MVLPWSNPFLSHQEFASCKQTPSHILQQAECRLLVKLPRGQTRHRKPFSFPLGGSQGWLHTLLTAAPPCPGALGAGEGPKEARRPLRAWRRLWPEPATRAALRAAAAPRSLPACKQITLACARSASATLGLPPLTARVASLPTLLGL